MVEITIESVPTEVTAGIKDRTGLSLIATLWLDPGAWTYVERNGGTSYLEHSGGARVGRQATGTDTVLQFSNMPPVTLDEQTAAIVAWLMRWESGRK